MPNCTVYSWKVVVVQTEHMNVVIDINDSRMNLETDRTDLKHAEAPRNLVTKRKETHRIHLSLALVLLFVLF